MRLIESAYLSTYIKFNSSSGLYTMKTKSFFLIFLSVYSGFSIALSVEDIRALEQEVFRTETAFAKTMAERDLQGFKTFIAKDAVFIGKQKLRGKSAIVETWKNYFNESEAPFSWSPETVAVIGDGDIALSTGPVKNSSGKVFAYYHSTWRKNKDGEWKIILDKGHKYCPPDPSIDKNKQN